MSTTVPAVGPLDVIIGQLAARRERLLRDAKAIGRLIRSVAPGETWIDVHDIELVIGVVYVVRRRNLDGSGDPGLSRWTKAGWHDEYGAPLSMRGTGVQVLVPSSVNRTQS